MDSGTCAGTQFPFLLWGKDNLFLNKKQINGENIFRRYCLCVLFFVVLFLFYQIFNALFEVGNLFVA